MALASSSRPAASPGPATWPTFPHKYGVTNVYGDVGQIFATTLVAQPRVCAALMGILMRGLGADRVTWGTDALWTGSPQWQIEGLRRLEIPEDMQKKYGFTPLGAGARPGQDGDLRRQQRRLYKIDQRRPAWRWVRTSSPPSRVTMTRQGPRSQ